ncbi:hypothetical protein [Saccharothrix sp. ALI-22-I]|uniref:hypothetical protein n=1 Tax=Saccharothrix sp. ALI-22-I TaxID=1933778 RepID=UPI00117B98C5|nr:hypothetical protein [Saccharothrix sp. ALI-22-I]
MTPPNARQGVVHEARETALGLRPADAPLPQRATVTEDCTLYSTLADQYYIQAQVAYASGDWKSGDFHIAMADNFHRLFLLCLTPFNFPGSGSPMAIEATEAHFPLSDLWAQLETLRTLTDRERPPALREEPPKELTEGGNVCDQYAVAALALTSQAIQAHEAGDIGLTFLYEQQAHAYWALYQLCLTATRSVRFP